MIYFWFFKITHNVMNYIQGINCLRYLYVGTLTGLLGDFDGNPGNDLLLPDGTSLQSNATEETIFRTFNTACQGFVCIKYALRQNELKLKYIHVQ